MIGNLVGLVRARGFRKGVTGSSRPWMAVWVVITASQFLRRRAARRAIVERFTLRPGESILITDLAIPESEAGPIAP